MNPLLNHYTNFTGAEEFQESLARFFEEFMKPRCEVTPEDVIVMNGCGTVLETVCFDKKMIFHFFIL